MRESELERILVDETRKVGGRAYKWVSPGNDGVPDRIVFLPGGKVSLVELKTDRGKLSAQQKIQINRLKKLGQDARVVRGLTGLAAFFYEAGYRDTASKLYWRSLHKEVRPDEVHTT